MAKVIRKKANFLPLINGVKFEDKGDHSVSEDIKSDIAKLFLEHDGYELLEEKSETAAEKKAREKAEKEAADKAAAEKSAAEAAAAADVGGKDPEGDKAVF